MAPKTSEKKVDELLKKHQTAVELLRNAAHNDVTCMNSASSLPDGTELDELFYLRYVLSSKEPLDSSEKVIESKSLQHLCEAVEWRCKVDRNELRRATHSLSRVIPIRKTGELADGTPVLFLPVNRVDFDLISQRKNDPKFQKEVMNFFLDQKADVFSELDSKTRAKGEIVKSIVVYDLCGLSYSHVFKMKDFFELVQKQSKQVKKFFPQSTEVTVFVNSPGSFLLKSFMTSSKQKIMTAKSFIKTYNARSAVPDLIGGTKRWVDENSASTDDFKELVLTPCAVREEVEATEEEVEFAASSKGKKTVFLTDLEREMITLKKNKVFSIAVLDKNQKVKMLFSNLRRKKSNMLIIVKEDGKVYKNTVVVPLGFASLNLELKTKGEVIIVYLDAATAKRFHRKDDMELTSISFKKTPVKKVLGYGKKKLNSHRANKFHQKNKFETLGLTGVDKVLFRFEISDAVVCGSFSGETAFTEEIVSEEEEAVPQPAEAELVDYDARSLRTVDSLEMKQYGEPSFFRAAAQIFRGW